MLSKESTKRASKFFQFSKEEIYMSELDKAISELVSAFHDIMPSAQAKPNAKATALSPEAEYWRQKYMNTLLAGQSIRTKTHDQERSTIANLQSQIRDLTETVQRKNREILALKEALDNRVSEHRVAIMNLQETVAELRERNAKILSDSKSKELYENLQRAADQSTMAEKNAALQKENDAYEALFRVLAETLREYDPKVKSSLRRGAFLT
jgi:hypothetical protein